MITCPLGVITASRDKTVRVWNESRDKQFQLDKSLVSEFHHEMALFSRQLTDTLVVSQIGHKSYVAPLAYIPEGVMPELPKGGIVSGEYLRSACWDS